MKTKRVLILILVLASLAVFASGIVVSGHWLGKGKTGSSVSGFSSLFQKIKPPTTPVSLPPFSIETWVAYENPELDYSIKHPKDWEVSVGRERGEPYYRVVTFGYPGKPVRGKDSWFF